MKTTSLLRLASCLVLAAPLGRLCADVQETWAKNCATCHGQDGAAKTKAARLCGAKDLTDAQYQKSFTDQAAFNDTKNGLIVDGKTKMRPFKDKLSDEDINSLVTYVRGLAK